MQTQTTPNHTASLSPSSSNLHLGPTPAPANEGTPVPRSRKRVWTGRILSGLVIAFLAFDGIIKLAKPSFVVEGTRQLGYPTDSIVGIGLVLLLCLAAYVVPRTSVLGAVLLTGYLGGAIATHVRVENPLFSHTLFPIYVAALIWGGLYLRDNRLRGLLGRRA